MGDWRLLFLHRDRLRKVTRGRRAARGRAYLKPSNRTVGLFIPTPTPDRAEIPAAPDVAALVKDYKGDAAVAAGEAFDPSPANIDARTACAALPRRPASWRCCRRRRAAARSSRTLTLRFGDEKSLDRTGQHRGAAGRRDADARHDEAHAPADPGRVRPAEGAASTSAAASPTANASIETTRENLPAVLAAGGRSAARAVVPGERVRAAEAAAAGGPRAAAQRSAGDRGGRAFSVICARTRRTTSATSRPSTSRSPTCGRPRSTTRRSSSRTSTARRRASWRSSATSTPTEIAALTTELSRRLEVAGRPTRGSPTPTRTSRRSISRSRRPTRRTPPFSPA